MKILKVLVLSLAVATLLTACGSGGGPEKSPEDVVSEGISNLIDVNSAEYAMSTDITFNLAEPEPGLPFTEFLLDLGISGAYDNTDRENPEFSFKINGNGTIDDGEEEGLAGEVRMTGGNVYFMVSSLTSFQDQIPVAFVEPYFNKWFFAEIPAEFTEILQAYSGEDDSELSEQEKQMKDLVKNSSFFKDVKYNGTGNVGGVNSYRYEVDLDPNGIVEYTKGVNEINGLATLSESDESELRDVLVGMGFDGEVWIGIDDRTIRKFAGNLEVEDLEDSEGSLDLEFSYELSNLNEDVDLEIPEGALDVMSLLGGAF
ncbi:MAG: hypothetical protein O3B47_00115 [bacterium]|nr:hypothetical protein [bacterium]